MSETPKDSRRQTCRQLKDLERELADLILGVRRLWQDEDKERLIVELRTARDGLREDLGLH